MGRGHQKGPAGATLQPRSRRESVFLICTLLIAGFFLWRVCQFKNTQQPQTVWVSTTFPRSHGHNTVTEDDDDSTRVVTELVIDNGRDGRGFRQPHNKQLTAPARKLSDPDRSASASVDGKLKSIDNPAGLSGSGSTSEASDKQAPKIKSGSKQAQGLGSAGDSPVPLQKENSSSTLENVRSSLEDTVGLILPGLQDDDRAATKSSSTGKSSSGQQQSTAKSDTVSSQEKSSAQLAVSERSGQRVEQKVPKVPADFDWQTYLLYHPGLKDEGIVSEETAKQHYLNHGRAEGYVYRRLRVMLRYTACTGLINQQYSHIAAFALAAVLGARVGASASCQA